MQALVKDKKRKLLHKKLSENIGKPKIGSTQQKASHNKHMPQYEKKELTFSPRTIVNTFKTQLILLSNFLVLQENLEYPQCTPITRDLTSTKKTSSVSFLKVLKEFKIRLLG